MRVSSPASGLIAVMVLCFFAAPLAVGAQDDRPPSGERAAAEASSAAPGSYEAALAAIDFDPWQIQDDEIEPRRSDVLSFVVSARAAATAASADVAETEAELEIAAQILDDAVAHRAAMEREVEGYSIAIWELGDHGLQEAYGSEAERARQAETVIATTEALIERVEHADAAIVVAEADVERVDAVLAQRRAVEAGAEAVLRHATQIRDRFDLMIAARSDAIDRWTHEALESESDDIEFATITSVEVQLPVASPAAASVPAPELAAQAEPGAAATDAQAASIPTQTVTIQIPPIVVDPEIAGQVRALIGAARSDGIDLHGGGYRPVADQITLRVAHCGTSGYDIFERPAGECTPPTATPGNSQHELGLAIDFTVNGAILSPASPGFAWLKANAASYGLINLPSEAWHWSTTGG